MASPAAVSKLWPRDTAEIFIRACAGFHAEYIAPCNCIISGIMDQMTHPEFMDLHARNAFDQDPRIQKVTYTCATKPKQKQ